MKRTLITWFVCLVGLLAIMFVIHKPQWSFDTTPTIPLTAELIKNSRNISIDQHYSLDFPMRFMIPIASEDGQKAATLMWPADPYGQILILIDSQDETLKTQTAFSGRLYRCIYQCSPGGFDIPMFDFVDLLESKYPKLKGKYRELPAYILYTSETPRGWNGFFEATKMQWLVVCVGAVVSLLVVLVIQAKREK